MSIEDFVNEYNWICSNSEAQTADIVEELYIDVSEMFQLNCGMIPKFELVDGGRKIKLL